MGQVSTRDVLGFTQLISFDDKTISTEYSALMSKVMANGNGRIKFPINEPAQGKKKSQIDEYLEFYRGPGVPAHRDRDRRHHRDRDRSCATTASSFCACRARTTTPCSIASARSTRISRRCAISESSSIATTKGYLLQIFTKPVEDRPTLFYEIIQRKGAKSFGAGNFKALFEALEREQDLRGNL